MRVIHHHHRDRVPGGNLLITVFLNMVITITEFLGGIFSNSLALISDALHNLGDTLSIVISYLALRIGKKEGNVRKTFGYKRIEMERLLTEKFGIHHVTIQVEFDTCNDKDSIASIER